MVKVDREKRGNLDDGSAMHVPRVATTRRPPSRLGTPEQEDPRFTIPGRAKQHSFNDFQSSQVCTLPKERDKTPRGDGDGAGDDADGPRCRWVLDGIRPDKDGIRDETLAELEGRRRSQETRKGSAKTEWEHPID